MPSLYTRPPFAPTRLPYRVHTFGWVADNPRHATLGTYNNDAMLTVVLSGRGYYRRGGEVQSIEAGMVGLVLPQPEVGVLLADERAPYEHVFCRFAGELALEAAKRIVKLRGGENFCRSPLWQEVAQPLLQMQGNKIEISVEEKVYPDRLRPCDGLLAQALAILDCPAGAGRVGLTAQSVEGYIAERLSAPVRIAQMADHFGVTKEYLCRRVKSLTGRSPLDLWREAKIGWAKALLSRAGLNVAETARRTGFDDPYYFSRVFKKCTGYSPLQFLRHAREKRHSVDTCEKAPAE